MPRPDGRLYPSEMGAFGPKKKPGPPKGTGGRPRKHPKPVEPQGVAAAAIAKLVPPKIDKRIRCTPAVLQSVCDSIAGGLSIESSCILAGISREGLDKFLKRNPAARDEFERAEREWEKQIVSKIADKADKDWKAGLALLERRMPVRWSQVGRTEHTGKDGGPVQVLTIHKQLLERVAKAGDKPCINVTATAAKD